MTAAGFVDGRWVAGHATLPVTNPADRTLVAELGVAGKAEAARAADAAAAAYGSWSGRPARDRADLLADTGRLLAARADDLGLLLSRETGKRLPEGVAEIRFAAEYFRWFAEQVRRPAGELLVPEDARRRQVTLSRPAGVAVLLTPWNFPVSIMARKLAPALAAGCTAVCRVSEKAPLAVTEIFRCLQESGLPPGAANLVHGPAAEITDTLLAHPAVRVVSFTGSTGVGRRIMALAARRIVRPLLELGGAAPFLVFDDADLDAAVTGAMVAKFRNNGQSCIAANRFHVQDGVYDEFRDRFAAAVDALAVGDPAAAPVPDLGPLIDDDRVAGVARLAADAEAAGARRITRSRAVPDTGSFLAPALYEEVPEQAGLACREVFGPVAALSKFRDEDEVIARANDTEMGLAGYFYTRDLGRAWRVAERLEVGIVGANTALPSVVYGPMGGVKQSGLGREGAGHGLAEFCETRYVTWEL
jgi:succinate-semialdehyde dehydrogenase / glutarate-semialdehyde dehydrogenase